MPVSCLTQNTILSVLSQLHWQRVAEDEVRFLAEYRNAPGWVALSFPEVAESMVPADAVIGLGVVEPYRISSYSLSVCC